MGLGRYKKPLVFFSALAIIVFLASWQAEVDLYQLVSHYDKGLEQASEHFPADWSALGLMLEESLVTIGMAAAATPMGALLSFIFGLAAAKNLAPPALRNVSRLMISTERATPEIVTLLFLIVAFGLGPYAGIIALAIGCVGMLGRLLADAIEEVDSEVLESIEMVGASKWQVIRFGVLPEVMPSFIANSIFRFEINIRQSVLLGAVGAGGIGYQLGAAMDLSDYQRATTAILVIVALVILSERISDALRKRILSQGAALK